MSLLKTLLSHGSIRCCRVQAPQTTVCINKLHDLLRTDVRKIEKERLTSQDDNEAPKLRDYKGFNKDWRRVGGGYIPDRDVYGQVFNGIKFENLPTLHIKCSRNNTKCWFIQEDEDGKEIMEQNSGGYCGYKNKKKGTMAAAQTVGYQTGKMMSKRGMPVIRVEIRGVGERMSMLRGLVIGGVTIVSISDKTYPSFNLRPIGPRRI